VNRGETPGPDASLKSGEQLEIGVVLGADAEWRPKLVPFLGHKSADYAAHIRQAREGPLDALQTRFYVGSVEGRPINQVMIVGDRGAGILGHVFTRPEERRKGACQAIFGAMMEDVARAGFRVLCLGTGFESPPYWIYHSFGFRSIGPGDGSMKWLAAPDAETALFRPGPTSVRELQWEDWGFLDLLAFQAVGEEEELPRSPTMGLKGRGSLEGPFASLQARRAREPEIQGRALVSDSGATVGWALLGRDTRWFRDTCLVEAYTHPGFTAGLPALLASLEWPVAPVAAYLTPPAGPRAAALEGAGFVPAATLPGWLEQEGRRDLTFWRR
jgi:hypothetical protein